MNFRLLPSGLLILTIGLALPAPVPGDDKDPAVDYTRDIKPILQAHCYRCHGVRKQEAGLRLDTAVAALKGSGKNKVLVPGRASASQLIQRVRSSDKDTRMPPLGTRLSAKQIQILTTWINAGATHPANETPEHDPADHWAFRRPLRPAIPRPETIGWTRNPIDAFLAARHEQLGLVPMTEASPVVLLRRVSLDLIGLPPTPDEVTAFLDDTGPDRWQRVVDGLLQNPRYGERWGRHWMDVWRYSDWYGYQKQLRNSARHIWRWRDWIVESLNQHRPYDEMIRQMLAADELPGATPETLRATGFLARNYYLFNRNVWLDSTIEHTGKAFLGLTINCARCHDHMYDPMVQRDYYRFRAIFEPHQIRTDPLTGQLDPEKEGVAVAYDAKADTPTYLFQRGNDKRPDKQHPLVASIPEFLQPQPFRVTTVQLAPTTYYPGARTPVRRSLLAQARETVDRHRRKLAAANKAVQVADLATKAPPPPNIPPIAGGTFLVDDFSKSRPRLWQTGAGKWTWEKARLVQSHVAAARQMYSTIRPHPVDFSVTLKLRIIGGATYHSVGIGFDGLDANNLQAVYLSAYAKGAKIQYTRLVDGQATYPAGGQRPLNIQRGRDYQLRLDIRGQWLNAWVDGQRQLVFRLPARRPGALSIWTYDAAAEFDSIRAGALNPKFLLAHTATAPGTTVPDLPQTRLDQVTSEKQLEASRAALTGLQARIAADQARLAGTPSDQAPALSLKAAQLHRQTLLRQVEADLAANIAEQHRAAGNKDDKKLAAVRKQRVTLDKRLQQARQAVADKKQDSHYPPLTKTYPPTSTGRRLALARWIASPENPLTARVCVNHVWMRHFGQPLVPSVFDFGNNGRKPTFPHLLDWLAVELTDHAWDLQHLHRLIVCSAAYRMKSNHAAADTATRNRDPDNRMLWRMNARRLESEAIRDSVLWVCGSLDARMGGPELDTSKGLSTGRRSLYYRHAPEKMMVFLDLFDAASTNECYRRNETIVPQQALALVNSRLAIEQSRLLSRQLNDQVGQGNTETIRRQFLERVFLRTLCRRPTADELTACLDFLTAQARTLSNPAKLTPFGKGHKVRVPPASEPHLRARENLVHVLINHNDFLTIR
jgi:mono/diheme cytochrome c family protein